PQVLAANLRKAFSGIVACIVKAEGIREIECKGPFYIHGDPVLMKKLDKLLQDCVEQPLMKLPGGAVYDGGDRIAHPC
ncbi:pyrimidine/purine nucleotide monophosphate nucleosidase domain-containing protein, partial [Vibrio parahaemolyticus]|uniref:pyrimidine/purine nucleotide monophosphate nucleosidase domain-containing protein n=1 Tax=Vibrio parahaemolyticus TaxID=670 RepID=UPI0021117B54